jgi:hypothetical protein
VEIVINLPSRRSDARLLGLRSSGSQRAIPAAHQGRRPGGLGQEGGEAEIASGWPPGFALSRRPLTPGGSMSAKRVQAFLLQQLGASASVRRRFVPPSLPQPVSQSQNQRWRERPRCPALPVAPDRHDGVVHASVGRVPCRRRERSARAGQTRRRVHRIMSEFAGTKQWVIRSQIASARVAMFPGRTSHSARGMSRLTPSRLRCSRRAQRRQCSSLRSDLAEGQAFGH